MILYKFSTFTDAKTVITSLKIKVSPPNSFNDPYELLPEIPTTKKNYSDYFKTKKEKNNLRIRLKNLEVFKGSKSDFERFFQVMQNNTDSNELINRYMYRFCRDICNILSEKFGILCLSKSNSNILLWSHYSDKHSGIAIGIDTEDDSFKNIETHPVVYTNERVKMPIELIIHGDMPHDDPKEIICTKFTDWNYEEEYRQIYQLSDLEYINKIYLKNINPSSIKEVIMGCNILKPDFDEIVNLLSDPIYKHIKLKHACLSKSDYKIEIIDYEDVLNGVKTGIMYI